MKYAIIENGVVVNIVIANAPMAANWRQDDNAGIGWVDVEGVLMAPAAPTPAPASRILTHLQYMNRFTQAELRAIYTLSKTVVDMEIWLDKFRQASHIDLDEQELADGLAALVAGGVLAANRPAEIRA